MYLLSFLIFVFYLSPIHSQNYKDLNNGTIQDIRHNLIWQKCTAGQDSQSCKGESLLMNWDSAIEYCKNLNLGNLQWSLPTMKELNFLSTRRERDNSCPHCNRIFIDLDFFPNTELVYYWSRDEFFYYKNDVFIHKNYAYFESPSAPAVYNSNESYYFTPKTSEMFVRCVSTGEKKKK